MLDLPSLVTSARAELGLPGAAGGAAAGRALAPDSPAIAPPRTLMHSRVDLPAVAGAPTTRTALGASTVAAPTLPATPLTPRFDGIHQTVESLGGRFRPAMQALADVANGSSTVLSREQVDQLHASRRGAATQLASLYAEGIEQGARSMPRAPRVEGNRVDLLVRNREYLPRLYEDLEAARESITVNQFNWEPDGSGKVVADLLREKARSGLDVRVMLDGYGINERGKDVADEFQRSLEQAGVKFVRTDGFKLGSNGFEHRKLITVDDRVTYTGGLGFGAKYDTWTDLMLRIEGPAAAVAGATQLGTFRELSGSVDERLSSRARSIGSTLRDAAAGAGVLRDGAPTSAPLADARAAVTLLDNLPGVDLASTEAFLRDAATATRRLWATSTYLTTDVAKRALVDAARRGVDVKLLMTGLDAGNDAHQIHLGRTLYRDMIDAGVEIYEYPDILHSKSWLKDDDVAAVGSMNLSKSSMARAREITARVEDPAFAQRYARFHEETRAGAKLVQPDELGSTKLKALGLLTRLGVEF